MAEHVKSETKPTDGADDLLTAENMQIAEQHEDYLCQRTFLSIIGGVVAGIFGFTGLKGFVLYFLLMSFTSLVLLAKSKISIHSYFDSRNRVLMDGFLGGLMLVICAVLDVSFSFIIFGSTSAN
ncbi:hypothetical protein HN51_002526 [Arachis hypogaea]|nr:ER membrane protein complex subunit [Arachis hypogaea]